MYPAVELAVGAIFAEQFQIISPLARGGMGVIYIAEQVSTRRRRALKLMQRELVQSASLREKFEREALMPSSIDSDHVAEVIAAGVDNATGLPWFAMELLEGDTLEGRIQNGSRILPAELLTIFEQVGHALAAAHRKGIVHRDLKPENVFLANQRVVGMPYIVKVLDFGIAKVVAEAGSTTTGAIGTPVYMAPEQYQGRGIGPQSDLWALGLMLFYAITRRCYWRGGQGDEISAATLMYEACMGEISPGSLRARELGEIFPEELDAWLARCLARPIEQRFASATEAIDSLREGLGRIIERQSAPAPFPGRAGTPLRASPAHSSAPPAPTPPTQLTTAAQTAVTPEPFISSGTGGAAHLDEPIVLPASGMAPSTVGLIVLLASVLVLAVGFLMLR